MYFIIVVYPIDRFIYVDPLLPPRKEAHLIIVHYYLLMYCHILFASILLSVFALMFIRDISLQFNVLCVLSLPDFSIRVMLAS